MSTAAGVAPTPTPSSTAPRGGSVAGSAIYAGTVFHQRYEPVEHGFRYRIFMPLFDLDELPELLDPIPLWTARDSRRPSPARFRRSDYLAMAPGDGARPLAEAARDLVAERTGRRPGGPVKLLANPRYWGLGINPVAFYYLYGEGPDAGVEAMIAEVTNTPWGERRSYVLATDPVGAGEPEEQLRGSFDKQLHVSPFMPMEQSYSWRATEPGDRLSVTLANHERGRRVFEAGIALERREITPGSMRRLLFTYPPMTATTLGRIYWQAMKLKLKGAPYFRNPTKAAETQGRETREERHQ